MFCETPSITRRTSRETRKTLLNDVHAVSDFHRRRTSSTPPSDLFVLRERQPSGVFLHSYASSVDDGLDTQENRDPRAALRRVDSKKPVPKSAKSDLLGERRWLIGSLDRKQDVQPAICSPSSCPRSSFEIARRVEHRGAKPCLIEIIELLIRVPISTATIQ